MKKLIPILGLFLVLMWSQQSLAETSKKVEKKSSSKISVKKKTGKVKKTTPEQALKKLLEERAKKEGSSISKTGIKAPPVPTLSQADKEDLFFKAEKIERKKFIKKESKIPWMKTLAAFLFVASLIFIMAGWVNKKMTGKKSKKLFSPRDLFSQKENPLTVVQALPMGVKQKIVLLDYCGKKILLGVSEGRFQVINQEETTVDASLNQDLAQEISFQEKTEELPLPQDNRVEIEEMVQEKPQRQERPKLQGNISDKIKFALKNMKNLQAKKEKSSFGHELDKAQNGIEIKEENLKNTLGVF